MRVKGALPAFAVSLICFTGMGQPCLEAITVTVATDTSIFGDPGSLRAAIINANTNPGSTITFQAGLPTIMLAHPLMPITEATTINGGPSVTIDGANAYSAFFADPGAGGTVSISNMTIQNTKSKGGDGGSGNCGGGGALGGGGAVFVNTGTTTLTNVILQNNNATGGNGGSANSRVGGGGGGGMAQGTGGSCLCFGFAGGGGGGGFGGVGGSIAASTQNAYSGAGGGGLFGSGGSITTTTNVGVGGGGGGAYLHNGGSYISNSSGSGGAGGGGTTVDGSNLNYPTSPTNASTGANGGAGGTGGSGGTSGQPGGAGTNGGGGGGGGSGGLGGNGSQTTGAPKSGGGGGGGGDFNNGGNGANYGGGGGGGGSANGGNGGSYGGGGASGYSGNTSGTGGDFGGGGGSGGFTIGNAGAGGFGGGGGGVGPGGNVGGAGGFGGGGGSGLTGAGVGGVGAGSGSGTSTAQAGGGGAGLGGAVFVRNGAALVINTVSAGSIATSGNTATAGTGIHNGGAAGTDVFIRTGSTLTMAPGTSDTLTIAGTIADDSAVSLPGGSYTAGNGAGGALTMNGAGTLILTGANTYQGGTTISAGTLQVNTTSLPSKPVTNNAALVFNQNSPGTFSGAISGSGTVTKQGTDVLTVSGTNTYGGTTTISTGTLKAGGLLKLSPNSSVTLANAASAILDLNSNSHSIPNLSGGGATGGNVTLGTNAILTLTNASGTYAGAISGTNGSLIKQGSGSLILTGTNTYTGTTTISAGTLQVNTTSLPSTPVTNNAALVFNQNSPGTFSGAMSGSGTLTKQGTDVLTLSGTNTYGGTTTISAGTLQVNTTSLPSTPVTNNAALIFDQNSPGTFSGAISGSGTVTKQGTDVLTVSGSNTYGGTTTISTGTLKAGGISKFSPNSSVTLANAASAILDLNGNNNSILNLSGGGTTGGNVTLGNATLTLTNASGTYAGAISGTNGNLDKQGSGALILTGTNTYTGTTTISAGTLQVNTTSLPSTPVTNNAALIFDQNSPGTFSGAISGSGTLTKQGTDVLTVSGSNTYGGTTTISTGTLKAGGISKFSPNSSVTLANDASAILDLNSNNNSISNLSGGGGTGGNVKLGNATLTLTNASGTYAGAISGTNGNLDKQGSGALILTGSNTYSGTTTISAGTLQAGAPTTLSPNSSVTLANAASAILDLNSHSHSIPNLSGGGTTGGNVNLGTATLTLTNASGTYAGAISGTGSIIKQGSGALILTGSNSYTGTTTISAGTLQADSTSLPATSVINHTALVFDQNSNGTFTGDISGSGTLTKQGTGLLNITGTNTYTGATTVSAGTLAVNSAITSATTVDSGATLKGTGPITGAVVVNGTLAPGNSIGTMTFIGNYTQGTGSTFENEITPTQTDLLDVQSGNITIQPGATFKLVPEAGPFDTYPDDTVYTVMTTTGTLSGMFDSLIIDPPFVTATLFYGSNYLDLIVTFTPLGMIATKGNAHQVAKAIDQIFYSGNDAMDAVIANLFSLEDPEIINALNQLQPAQLKAQTLIQQNNAVKVRDALFTRLSTPIYDQRCNVSCCGDEAACCAPEQDPLTVWVDGLGDWLHQDSTHYASSPQVGYHNTTDGLVLGTDYHFADIWNAGVLGAYTHSKTEWSSHHGYGSMNSGYFGLYASAIGKWAYALASTIGSWSGIDSTRDISYPGENALAKGHTSSSQLTSSLDVGLNFGWKGFTFSPFDIFDYVAQKERGFTEKNGGAVDLKVRKSHAILLRNELGINVARCQCFGTSRWIADAKVSWVRETRIRGGHYTASFVDTTPTFTVTGYMPDRSLVSPGASLTALFSDDGLTFGVYYNGLFGHEYADNTFGIEAAYSF